MVCSKCQKLTKGTTLVTPQVKKKSEMYYGSAASSKSTDKKTTTLANAGSKLLSKSAKNPYAQYSSSCSKCKTKVSQGFTYCQSCAYQSDGEKSRSPIPPYNRRFTNSLKVCAMCGKANKKGKAGAPVISGQKFNLK
ncbi:hypothetical protein jhhlp_001244 [Lomentospora prolificans]|uniref:Cysteine-rich PDZ-binding protein n=1 Tax=Lomentospora prolificans TaxID=41688 RepID=A0A2N3NHP2_9PEZI|nr:hypothetical protein jhhlp_001244 [Lomentospora prolificans]